jgi:periplasmic protein TonB
LSALPARRDPTSRRRDLIYRFDRTTLARVLPVGASVLVHVALLAVAAIAAPGVTARVQDVVAVDLVAVEPPARIVETAPLAPPAPKAKPLTLPKPIVTPAPKVEERREPPARDPEPAAAPPAPQVATAPAPAPAAPSALPAPAAAAPAPPAPIAGRSPDPGGVSWVESAPKAAAPAAVASVPATAGLTSLAKPTGGYQVRPSYPSTARRLGVQGTTLLRVHVLEDGRVGGIDVEQSAGHPDLDQAATDAVRRWRFEPARRGEQAVAMWVRLPVEFRLK